MGEGWIFRSGLISRRRGVWGELVGGFVYIVL